MTTDNPLDQLLAEITYNFKLGQKSDEAAEDEQVRAARWGHLIVAVHLLYRLRARVEADGGDYGVQIDRLIKVAKEFDISPGGALRSSPSRSTDSG